MDDESNLIFEAQHHSRGPKRELFLPSDSVRGRRGRSGVPLYAEMGDIDGLACLRGKNWHGRDHGSMIVRTLGLPPIREDHRRCQGKLCTSQAKK